MRALRKLAPLSSKTAWKSVLPIRHRHFSNIGTYHRHDEAAKNLIISNIREKLHELNKMPNQRDNCDAQQFRRLFDTVKTLLAQSNAYDLSWREISDSLCVLKHSFQLSLFPTPKELSPELAAYVSIVSNLIEQRCQVESLEGRSKYLSSRVITKMLGGLTHLPGCDPAVERLTRALTVTLSELNEPLTASGLVHCVFALQHIRSSSSTANRLLRELGKCIDSQPLRAPLTIDDCGKILYGFKNLNSDDIESVEFMSVCLKKIKESVVKLIQSRAKQKAKPPVVSPLVITGMCKGLRNKSTNHQIVRDMIDFIASMLTLCPQPFLAKQMGTILVSLHRCSSSDYSNKGKGGERNRSIDKLLRRLLPRIEELTTSFDSAIAAGGWTHGGRLYSTEYLIARGYLINGAYLCNMLYGLQNVRCVDTDSQSTSSSFSSSSSKPFSTTATAANDDDASDVVPKLLSIIATQIDRASAHVSLTGVEIAMLMIGMKNMSCDSPSVRRLLQSVKGALQQQLLLHSNNKRKTAILSDSKQLGMVFTGMQSFDSDYVVVGEHIRIVCQLLEASSSIFPSLDKEAFAILLFSLNKMKADNDEVKELLKLLTRALDSNRQLLLDGNTSSRMLYGIKRLSSDCEEVQQLIRSLATALQYSYATIPDFTFTANEIGLSLNGLFSQQSKELVVRSLLTTLCAILERTIAISKQNQTAADATIIDSHSLRLAMQGMVGMDSSHVEVQRMLQLLTELIRLQCSSYGAIELVMDSRSYTAAINGMRLLRSEHAVVQEFLSIFLKHVALAKGSPLSMLDIRAARVGLQHMDPTVPVVGELLRRLEDSCDRNCDPLMQ